MIYRGEHSIKKLPPGRKRGLIRLSIVAAVLWFAFWGLRAFSAYRTYEHLSSGNFFNQFDAAAEAAWYRFVGSLIASILYPAILGVLFLVIRWVWRGFREPNAD